MRALGCIWDLNHGAGFPPSSPSYVAVSLMSAALDFEHPTGFLSSIE